MPRYFFQITENETIPDPEGMEMSGLAAVRRAAVDIAATRLKGSGEEFWTEKPWRLEVADDTGAIVVALTVTKEGVTTS